MDKRNALLRTIADHPWTSAQDFVLLVATMSVAALLALEYDLFRFAGELTVPERKITLAETIALTCLLAISLSGFILRRLHEQRQDSDRRIGVDLEMRKLRDLALLDPLTGLPNRRAVLARLDEVEGQTDGRKHVFFLLDLNGFKRVNDLHGHAVGDRVLQVVVERFKRVARPSDVLGRLGGDEFAVLSYDVDKSAAAGIGQRFLSTLEKEIWAEGSCHDVGVSVGAAIIPDDGSSAQEILRNADLAMYRAKDKERSSLVFFDAATDNEQSLPRIART